MFSEIENDTFYIMLSVYKEHSYKISMPEEYLGKEDRYWAKEIINKGHSYLYDPNQVVYHFWTKNGATWRGLV